jgi:hypothetical protein
MPHLRIAVLAAAAGVLLVSSLLSGAVPRAHDVWFGLVLGRAGHPMRAAVEMAAGSTDTSTVIDVRLTQDSVAQVRGWQVRRGSCERGGAVLGAPTAYVPLRVDDDGTAMAQITLAVALPDSGEFHALVRASPRADSPILGCGALLLED